MNLLMMTLLYPADQLDEVTRCVKDKVQYQINNYQRAFEKGIRGHLAPGESLTLLNSLPVGVFPIQYRKCILRGGWHDGRTIRQIGSINLPWFKQQMRYRMAVRHLKAWVGESQDNRTVLLYTQYLPYMRAVAKVKKRFPDLKAAVIVTDLPKDLGLASGRRGFFKRLEYRFADQSLALFQQMDGFVLLTAPMAHVLPIDHKPYTVIEGLIQPDETPIEPTPGSNAVLYTGTLEPELGIRDMLEAFQKMPDVSLWICGQGSMMEEVRAFAEKWGNIQYYGFVSQKEALALQARASALINPRKPNGAYTKYSFPSKTLEYLRSGKPVLCYRLEGIPNDYDPYLYYIETDSNGICRAVREVLALSEEERQQLGAAGRAYVLSQKNPHVQCERLMALLRQL